MIRNISLYVKDILQNMRDAEEFIQGLSYDGFVADKRTFNAVVRSLEVKNMGTLVQREIEKDIILDMG